MLCGPDGTSRGNSTIHLAILNARYERMRDRPEDVPANQPFPVAIPLFDLMSTCSNRMVAKRLTQDAWNVFHGKEETDTKNRLIVPVSLSLWPACQEEGNTQ